MKDLGTRLYRTYVGGRTCLVCWRNGELFVVMSTVSVRKNIFVLLMVTIAKEDNSVHPYGLMVRLGGDQDK
jgi:hypothetical protein